jgi:hypothetical protein
MGNRAATSGVVCSPGTSFVGMDFDSITKEQLLGDMCREWKSSFGENLLLLSHILT